MNEIDVANTIYDTIMGNVGFSEYHVQFPIEAVSNQEISGNIITFEIGGIGYQVTVQAVHKGEPNGNFSE